MGFGRAASLVDIFLILLSSFFASRSAIKVAAVICFLFQKLYLLQVCCVETEYCYDCQIAKIIGVYAVVWQWDVSCNHLV